MRRMPAPSRPSRASSIASVDSTTSHTSNALLGASIAFGRSAPRTPVSPLPITSTSAANNGALAAASTVGTGTGIGKNVSPNRSSARPPPSRPASFVGSSSRAVNERAAIMDLSKLPSLAPPPQRPTTSRSPSHQAAVLATTRAVVPPQAESATGTPISGRTGRPRAGTASKKPPVAPKPRRLSEHHKPSPVDTTEKPTDTTSIAPTTSLVDLFERRSNTSTAQGKRPQPIVIKPSDDLSIKSPKPVRSGITSMFQLELGEKAKEKVQDLPQTTTVDPVKQPPPRTSQYDGNSSDDSFASASEDLNARSPRSPPISPTVAAARRASSTISPSPGQTLRVQNDAMRRPAVSPSPLRYDGSKPIDIQPPRRVGTAGSDTLSVASSHSLKTIPAQYHQAWPRRMTPLSTGDDPVHNLANALVGAHLASSRAPSPTRSEGPPVPTRKKKSHHNHHKLSFSRTPSPAKAGMLRTLRKQEDSSSSSDEENGQHPYGHHRKKRLVRKHPNKHHEGDRKRWRDAVTERERKRYEGVWAANKGLHCSFTFEELELFRTAPSHQRTKDLQAAAGDQISNFVARDIWNRSRLPENVLETVWDLVDHDLVGRLSREEFVVGMWLIDQRLKGRKLPTKVTESVWVSVRAIHGIKVKVRK